jgi:hypothetical protein
VETNGSGVYASKEVRLRTNVSNSIVRPAAMIGASRQIYLWAALSSLVLSAWSAWAQYIPNPDGVLYLRAAELFAHGDWAGAIAVYHWPFYSAVIASVMVLTGLTAFLAAQIASAVFAVITTIAFIGLVNRLAKGDQLVVVCAAVIILMQPQLAQLRPVVIRDNGYFAFLTVALYFVACDIASPKMSTKFFIAAAVVVAELFRFEGFYLAALAIAYYLTDHPRKWASLAFITALSVCFLLIFGALLWDQIRGSGFTGRIGFSTFANEWTSFNNGLAAHLHIIKDDLLRPWGAGNAWGAYFGMTLGIAVVNIVRAVTIPIAILTVFAFVPKRAMPRSVERFTVWFSFGQLPVLLVFTFVFLLLDKRYAVGFAIVLDICLAFLLSETLRDWPHKMRARIFLTIAAFVLVGTWAYNIPRPSKLGYLRDSGYWVGREVPKSARVLTNDGRIAYYSGRSYGDSIRVWSYGFEEPLSDAQLATFSYFVLRGGDVADLPAAIVKLSDAQLVRSFAGKDGNRVFVYKRTQEPSASGQQKK